MSMTQRVVTTIIVTCDNYCHSRLRRARFLNLQPPLALRAQAKLSSLLARDARDGRVLRALGGAGIMFA